MGDAKVCDECGEVMKRHDDGYPKDPDNLYRQWYQVCIPDSGHVAAEVFGPDCLEAAVAKLVCKERERIGRLERREPAQVA